MSDKPNELTISTDRVQLVFVDGEGAAYWLDGIDPETCEMSPRSIAIGIALVELAKTNLYKIKVVGNVENTRNA